MTARPLNNAAGVATPRDRRLAAANRLLEPAGVLLDGPHPCDPQVHDARAIDAVMRHGSLGAGEAYMRGWWDAERLDEFFFRVLRAGLYRKLPRLEVLKLALRARLANPQARRRATAVADSHYNLDNELFERMLDRRMTYSCAYWVDAADLDAAQEAKLDLVCRKLHLRRGQRVLDIGCGWGSFCRFAAERYGVEVVGTTISKEQVAAARRHCAGLPVEIRLEDYRRTAGRFDRVVSIGMFEHVGVRNYPRFFDAAVRCLAADGLFLLHTIGGNRSSRTTDPWIHRYIFPNGQLPSLPQLSRACEGRFIVEDLHNFGTHYDRTLLAWHDNFTRAWPELAARYDDTFYRMWTYYLLQSAGAFRARDIQLWQVVLSPQGQLRGYRRQT